MSVQFLQLPRPSSAPYRSSERPAPSCGKFSTGKNGNGAPELTIRQTHLRAESFKPEASGRGINWATLPRPRRIPHAGRGHLYPADTFLIELRVERAAWRAEGTENCRLHLFQGLIYEVATE